MDMDPADGEGQVHMAQLLWRVEVTWHSCCRMWWSHGAVDVEERVHVTTCCGRQRSHGTVAEGGGHVAQLPWKAEVTVDAEGEVTWHSCSGRPSSHGTVDLEGRDHVAQLMRRAQLTRRSCCRGLRSQAQSTREWAWAWG